MNTFLKYLGVIVLLVGVIVLAVPAFMGNSTNTILITGLSLIILGYFAHIILNKKIQE